MNEFLNWFNKHRKSIGYVVGGLNLGSGFGYIASGEVMTGIIWLLIGTVIVIDTKEFK
jgi:hypothetical protein